MQRGQLCRLCSVEDWVWRPPRTSKAPPKEPEEWLVPLVLGIIVGVQPHTETPERQLYFFRPSQVVLLWASVSGSGSDAKSGGTTAPVRYRRYHPPSAVAEASTGGKGDLHRRSDLHMGPQGFSSADGYAYRHDGWYDAEDLEPLTEALVLSRYGVSVRRVVGDVATSTSTSTTSAPSLASATLPQSWLASMDAASACCEVRYLCYAFRPWFSSAFESLPYLALPERHVCYSVHLCHRCLTPFFSLDHLMVHLEGYCPHGRRPPGPLLYLDHETGRRIYFVDGAQHLHYGRCLSLLGKGFIESKLIQNDVDIYEFFVVTIPRQSLPFVPSPSAPADDSTTPTTTTAVQSEARAFRAFVGRYDAEEWDGETVVGYFSRLKHQPHHALSCIMTLPCFQRMQLGSFMLDAAYHFASARQTQCGCRAFCGAADEDGASISRPFSPQGQALLIAYWRRAVLRCVWRRHRAQTEARTGTEASADRTDTSAGHTAEAPPSSPSAVMANDLNALRRWLPIPVSLVDLQFVFLHSDFAFYVPTGRRAGAEASAMSPARPRTLSLLGRREHTAAPVTRCDFDGSLVFDAAEVDEVAALAEEPSRALPGSFDAKWLRRLPCGELVYNQSLFHH